MGIADRIQAAKLLIGSGLHNDALILILVAIGASSRKQYSKGDIKYDNQAFKSFLKEGIKNILYRANDGDVNYIDGLKLTYTPQGRDAHREEHSIEEIIYEQYRNAFIHEGGLPPDVLFTDESIGCREWIGVTLYDKTTASMGVTHEEVLVMTFSWLDVLIKVVEQAAINTDLFGPAPSHENDGQPFIILLSTKAS